MHSYFLAICLIFENCGLRRWPKSIWWLSQQMDDSVCQGSIWLKLMTVMEMQVELAVRHWDLYKYCRSAKVGIQCIMKRLTDSRRRPSGSSMWKRDSESDNEENTICSCAAIKRSVVYYLKNSTLHGLKYIAEESITIPERLMVF